MLSFSLCQNTSKVYILSCSTFVCLIYAEVTEYEPAWDWSKKWDLPKNPTECSYLTIGREVPLRLSFFPDGTGTPIPVSTLVKDLGVQTDNMFSPSALFRLVSVFLVYSLKKAASLIRRKFLLRNVYRWTPKNILL